MSKNPEDSTKIHKTVLHHLEEFVAPKINPIKATMTRIPTLNLDYCVEYLVKFVEKNDLTKIFWRSDIQYDAELHRGELRDKLRPQAKIASELPWRMDFINKEFLTEFAILSLYDIAILVDDSQSMVFDEQGAQIEAMKKILAYISDIYARTTENHHIRSIHFLNARDTIDVKTLQAENIDKKIDHHDFQGLTKLGTGLMLKLLKPLVFEEGKWDRQTPRKVKQLQRPLLVIVIAGGQIEGEPLTRLPQAIRSVHESLRQAGYADDNKAVRFQFVCLGNDKESAAYYNYLDNRSKVKTHVDTLRWKEIKDVIGTNENLTELQQRKILKLFLGPIIGRFDKDVRDIICDDGDDDFDDNEDDEWDYFKEY